MRNVSVDINRFGFHVYLRYMRSCMRALVRACEV